MPVYPVDQDVIETGQEVRLQSLRVSAGFPSPAGDDLEEEIDPIA